MEDKTEVVMPTVKYGPDGEVVSEPDVQERYLEMVRQREAEKADDADDAVDPPDGGGLGLSTTTRRRLHESYHGDCCELSEAVQLALNDLELPDPGECCQRMVMGKALYMLDRRMRGKSDEPIED